MADLHINDNKGWKYKWSEYEDSIIKNIILKMDLKKFKSIYQIGIKVQYNQELRN